MSKRGSTRDVGDEEAHQPLQAILLADSFTQKFKPITLERPKVLLPLVNVPMLDYTLEWLASAGVEEVFLFCCAHAEQVISHLQSSKWQTLPKFKVSTIVSHNCVSPGEALRLMDEKNIIRSDFILISGDTVCNMPLEKVLEEHKARRVKDKQAVMTMVVKRCKTSPTTHQTRLGSEELLVAICPETHQLLRYEHGRDAAGGEAGKGGYIKLDTKLFQDRPSVQLCTDLQDCFVDICAPEVLYLFTDNFDYQHLRRDFVKGLLSDEIMGNKIYTHEISQAFASRVDSLRSYDIVSNDIIHRWTYPLVLDTKFGNKSTNVRVSRGNVYKDEGLTLARTAVIGENTVLGSQTSIGENSKISNSVIGRNCTIGANVTIRGSYLWDNVKVEDNVSMTSALLCDGVTVRAGAILEPGVVLSFKVEIGAGFTVPAYSKISLIAQPEEDDDSDEELEYDQAGIGNKQSPQLDSQTTPPGTPVTYRDSEVGVGGKGCRWVVREGSEEEEWRQSVAPIPLERLKQLAAAMAEDEAEETVADAGASKPLEEEEDEEEEDDVDREFSREIMDTFRRGVVEKVKHDNVALEINALKLAYNKTFAECGGGVFKTMLALAIETKPASSKDLLAAFRKILTEWGPLLRRYIKSEEEEVEVLLVLEEACMEDAKDFAPFFSNVAKLLYDADVVSEEGLFQWADEKKFADEADRKFLTQCRPFLEWLKEAEEEEEEESDEEEEEEEEEESEEEEEEEAAPPDPKVTTPSKNLPAPAEPEQKQQEKPPPQQKETVSTSAPAGGPPPKSNDTPPQDPPPRRPAESAPTPPVPEKTTPEKRPQSKPMEAPKTLPRTPKDNSPEKKPKGGVESRAVAVPKRLREEVKSESFNYEPGLGEDSDVERNEGSNEGGKEEEEGSDGGEENEAQSREPAESLPSELLNPSVDFENKDKYLKSPEGREGQLRETSAVQDAEKDGVKQ